MTVKIKIEGVDGGLNAQTSKADEIAILKALLEKVHGTQTYLGSLFTKDFVMWVETAIRDDVSTDMMDHLMACQKEIGDVRATVGRLMQEAESDRKVQALAYSTLKSDKENVEAHWKAVRDRDEEVIRGLNESVVAWNRKAHDLMVRLDESEKGVERRDREILELKARLYDLTEGQKGGKEDGKQEEGVEDGR